MTEVGLGAGVHNIVHQLWRLQKAGLVTFREASNRGVPTRIRLTEKGIRETRDWE